MRTHKCRCLFVPPHVLESVAKSGREEVRGSARLSIQQSNLTRQRRQGIAHAKFPEMLNIQQGLVPTAGQAKREVWNCQQQMSLRIPPRARGEGEGPSSDEDVNQMYDHVGTVRDYLQNVLGRNSYDNNGTDLIANVHVGVNYNNAFWDGDEFAAGDGDGVIFISFARSLDVIAHEIGHGVVQTTANLEYYSQSGALNEHFADVFGTVITRYANGQTEEDSDWLIGNEIMGPELYGECLRSMAAPGSAYDNSIMGKDPQPDHMNWYFTGPEDNRGVHINSGIPNKAFYLFAMERGTDVAARIWSRALQDLWSTANFNDAVEVIANAARVLVRDGVAPAGSPQTVRWAFKEVGLPTEDTTQ
jgi:Zn-dependent metalloprotease